MVLSSNAPININGRLYSQADKHDELWELYSRMGENVAFLD